VRRGILEFQNPRFAAREGRYRRLRSARSGWRTGVKEVAMILSFWLVMFLLLPTVGLGAFAFLMNREQHHHH
jgi:hypothetical protein